MFGGCKRIDAYAQVHYRLFDISSRRNEEYNLISRLYTMSRSIADTQSVICLWQTSGDDRVSIHPREQNYLDNLQ
jgi:hypothetical protein